MAATMAAAGWAAAEPVVHCGAVGSAASGHGNIHLLCYSFNQDYSCFVCGTTAGFRVYTASPVREIRRRERSEASAPAVSCSGALASEDAGGSGGDADSIGGCAGGSSSSTASVAADTSIHSGVVVGGGSGGWNLEHRAVGVINMLFQTHLYTLASIPDDDGDPSGLAGGGSGGGPKKVKIWDDGTQKVLREIRSRHEIKGVAVRRDIVAVVCEHSIYVYDGDTLRPLRIFDTAPNPLGLCVLTPATRPWMLCCPGKSPGSVRVQVGLDDRDSHEFEAHQTELSCLAVNSTGALVATASQHGTVVKVWRARDGQLLHRLRRSARRAAITSIAFREDDRFLAVASMSSTVHVFRLDGTAARCEHAASPRSNVLAESGGSGSGRRFSGGSSASTADVGDTEVASAGTASPVVTSAMPSAGSGAAVGADAMLSDVVEVMKGAVVPNYFNDQKSFAQFRLPELDADGGGRAAAVAGVDLRDPKGRSTILGPKVGFRGSDAFLLVLHYNGVLYEVAFSEDLPSSNDSGPQECRSTSSALWFASRPGFRVQADGPAEPVELVAGDNEDEGDAWQLL